MDRQYVIDNELVERYLRDQLGVEQAEAFEQYFITCPETMDDLELARALRKGMKEAQAMTAVEVQAVAEQRPHWLQRLLRPKVLPAVAMAAAVMMLVPLFFAATVEQEVIPQSQAQRLTLPLLRSNPGEFLPAGIADIGTRSPVTLVLELGYSDYESHRVKISSYPEPSIMAISGDDLRLQGEGDLEWTVELPPGSYFALVEGVEASASVEELARFAFQLK